MASNGNAEGGAVGAEKINTEIITLTRFLTEEQAKHKEATGDFTYVVVISTASCYQLMNLSAVSCAMPSNLRLRVSRTISEELP